MATHPVAHRVEPGERVTLAERPTHPGKSEHSRKAIKRALADVVGDIAARQRLLYADNRYSLLLIFQAMDAAGKDSTIRHVLSGVNPAGFEVHAFKQPSRNELDHDFLWRSARALPQRGRIGVFNRSYYEEVLVVRVHPSILDNQQLPEDSTDNPAIWEARMRSMIEHEQHLVRNGTRVLKFFLHVSPDEQARRFLDRLDKPHKNWKFSPHDLAERGHWAAYQSAYEAVLSETSTSDAPWFVVPADDKPQMRLAVAEVIRDELDALPLRWPTLPEAHRASIDAHRKALRAELGD